MSYPPANTPDLPALQGTVYQSLSIPVTLIDTQGLILDVNQAFLDYASNTLGRPVGRADRVGRPITAFVRQESIRALLADFVRRIFAQRAPAFLNHESPHPITGETVHTEIEGIPLPDARGDVVAAALLRRDLTDSRLADARQARRRQALQMIRDSIWRMQGVDDNYLLIEALYQSLPRVDMPLEDCSVNAVDASGPEPLVRFYDTVARQWVAGTEEQGSHIVLDIWRGGAPVYRRDLQASDDFGERDHIEEASKAPVRSVVDVPFSRGTLAVNSTEPDAFSADDIAFLREMALVIDEGLGRLQDLENLAEQARTSDALAGAIAAVADGRDLAEVLQKVVDGAARVTRSARVVLYLWDEDRQLLVPQAQIGRDEGAMRRISLRKGESLSGRVFAGGEPLSIDERNLEAYLEGLEPENRAAFIEAIGDGRLYPAIAVPLLLENRPVGTLSVADRAHPYDRRDIDLLRRISEQAVLAIDRARREEEFTASEARYRTLFEESPEPLAVHADGRYLFVNQAAARVLGAESPGQLAGYPVIEVIHPDDRDLIRARLDQLRAGRAVPPAEIKLVCLDGRVIDAQAAVKAVPYYGRRAMQSTFTDITARKLAEEKLKIDLALQKVRNEVLQMRGEDDWAAVARRCHEGLAQFVHYNKCGFTLLDPDSDTYQAFPIDDDGLIYKHAFDRIPASLRQVVATGAPVYRRNREEIRQYGDINLDGVGCIVDVPFLGGTLALNSLEENAFTERDIGILTQFAQVMSEGYRRLEDLRQLARQGEALAQSQKMDAVGLLAGGIAHDFNNMLTAILTACDFMRRERGEDAPADHDLDLIKQAAEQAAMLTRQLLAFGRRQHLQPRVVDLNRIVTDTQQMLGRLIGEHIAQHIALDAEAGWVRVDSGQIEQVLFNLAINARDAMPGGGRLSLETANAVLEPNEGKIPPGSYVTLRVSDTGTGMDEETLARIFEPFFTTKEPGRGTGMGLAMVYGVVQQSGGHVAVDSALGRGTTFTLYLPLAEAEPEAGEEAPAPDAELGGSETILLVENEDMVRSVTGAALARNGYQVLEARDGDDALRVVEQRQGPLDLVLTDVVMPGMSGQTLVDLLLADRPGLRVLFMSGYLREANLHGRPFLPKPFTPEILGRKVREVLDG